MFDQLDVVRMAGGLARHAAARQAAVARNMANLNTPGYKQVDVPRFAEAYAARAGGQAQSAQTLRATRPGHARFATAYAPPAPREVADARQSPNGNSVSLETEIVKAAELRQDHEMALSVYRSTLTVLRASIGGR